MKNEKWVAEYSKKQNAFHVDILETSLSANIQTVLAKDEIDYLIFGIFDTIDEANAACDAMAVRQERHRARELPEKKEK